VDVAVADGEFSYRFVANVQPDPQLSIVE
jgi:hypothetical protein